MKAVLIIDEPPCCNSCRFEHLHMCMATNNRKSVHNLFHRQSWCPLKRMPEKLDETFVIPKKYDYFRNGFNELIEEIEG